MPDEPVANPELEAPYDEEPAFLREPQEASLEETPEPAPEPEPEEESIPDPDFLTQSIYDAPPAPQQTQPMPQYVPVPVPQYPQYPPQMPPQPVQPPPATYTLDQFVQDPSLPVRVAKEQAKREIMSELMPIIGELQATRERTQKLDNFARQQHESSVANAFEKTRGELRDVGYNGVFKKDPAYRNEAVRERVDLAVRGYLARATEAAHLYGDFSGYQNAVRPSVLKAILTWAKEDAGWSAESSPQPVRIAGATVQQTRTTQAPREHAELDPDLIAVGAKMGVTADVLAQRLKEYDQMHGRR